MFKVFRLVPHRPFSTTSFYRPPLILKSCSVQPLGHIRSLLAQKEIHSVGALQPPQYSLIVFGGQRPPRIICGLPCNLTKKTKLIWYSFEHVQELCPDSLNSSVLLDVSEDGTPCYSIQVGYLPVEATESLEKYAHGKFQDLRVALFLVSWREAHTLSRANSLFMWNRNTAFCGKCGSPTERNNAGCSRKCCGCGMVHYPSSSPVGIVMVTDPSHEHALLVRQPRHPPGMYSCVAGFSDVGETLEETVRREVAEEVGLEVQEVQYAASQHWPFPSSLMVGCFAVADKEELNIDVNVSQKKLHLGLV
ncbi:unnamed protein product [Meganyctiphanes norvegica]|uniref:NAD(+) diphosphatase n=1 Tax=Meganyctiphanes norvegica TaxID=48144 RepID=A0AAV2RXL1_MEGNR